ncbi:hypothetical protein CC78DRAFT_569985 [Lojkania enalia]|uniref:Glycosyltransferase family 1 protein n=1 Tax=Lojkania enalia TaxID=147567 RepID=A0A9P4N243_9PLEO|nr:hypothetical protein CC78DRAFT_569985 [Didymosphaeria enalia]
MTVRGIQDNGRSENGQDNDTSSFLHVEETISNADLYSATPPAYALSAAEGEISVVAEAIRPEKSARPGSSNLRPELEATSTRDPVGPSYYEPVPGEANHVSSQRTPTQTPNDSPPVYFQELAVEAAQAHVKTCSILQDRPAAWLVKRKEFALSPLAATVLVKEGLVRSKDLELISQSAGMKRDPTDPLSAVAFATYDTVGDVLLGLVEGPVEAYRQVTPMLSKNEQKEEGKEGQDRALEEANLGRRESVPNSIASSQTIAPGKSASELGFSSIAQGKKPVQSKSSSNAAKNIAIGTGKGLGRIVGAGFKAPMAFTHGLTRGFHNAPKLYGDEVREYENVTDLKSGLAVSAKGFGHGLSDGISGLFVKPIQGAQENGVLGVFTGFGKGIGGIVCKPAAGAIGLVGYSSMGVYKEIRKLKPGNNSELEIFRLQGEVEYEQSGDKERLAIVKKWCLISMRQHS